MEASDSVLIYNGKTVINKAFPNLRWCCSGLNHLFSITSKQRASCVRNTINQRHEKKLDEMRRDYNQYSNIDRFNWLFNLSKKPLTIENAHYSRKVQSFPAPPPVCHIKTLSLRLKLQYESSLTKRKILSARTLPAFYRSSTSSTAQEY